MQRRIRSSFTPLSQSIGYCLPVSPILKEISLQDLTRSVISCIKLKVNYITTYQQNRLLSSPFLTTHYVPSSSLHNTKLSIVSSFRPQLIAGAPCKHLCYFSSRTMIDQFKMVPFHPGARGLTSLVHQAMESHAMDLGLAFPKQI